MNGGLPRSPAAVLLVEDDPLIRECLAEGLTESGCNVVAAATAEHALLLVDAGWAPEVVVTDFHLGAGMRGPDLITAIQSRLPTIRAVLVTGADIADPGLAPGDLFLAKPFHIDALADAIAELARKPAWEACRPCQFAGADSGVA